MNSASLQSITYQRKRILSKCKEFIVKAFVNETRENWCEMLRLEEI